ncbi:MAG TPA: SGNH/GDSL hydrolase family protein [Thermoanaerobaculia bacterium]
MALFLQPFVVVRTAAVIALALALGTSAANAEPPHSRVFGAGRPLVYVVLGDSTAAGVGGHYERGIAVSTAQELGRSFRVEMFNLSVSGARIGDLRRQQLPVAMTLRPDIVLISAAANDVTHLTPLRAMREDFIALIDGLRTANPNVRIVMTGSPDMGSPPRIPRLLRGWSARRTTIVNRMLREEAAKRGVFVSRIAEETGPQFRRDRSLFADDDFHPNDRGYATWMPVLNATLREAVAFGAR